MGFSWLFTEPNEFPVRLSSPKNPFILQQNVRFLGIFLETPPIFQVEAEPNKNGNFIVEPTIDFQGRAVSFREGKGCLKNIS